MMTIPPPILQGIAALSRVKDCEIVRCPEYLTVEQQWLLLLRITNASASEFVPATTDWCVLIDRSYPFGNIDIYPSKTNGITVTFPHQSRNEYGEKYKKWRKGRICLDTPIRGLGVLWQEQDPVGDAENRLSWYGRRATSWVEAAIRGELLKNGDPFEFPDVSYASTEIRIIHDEDSSSFLLWDACDAWSGLVTLEKRSERNHWLAISFEDMNRNVVRRSPWFSKRKNDLKKGDRVTGIWWRWKSVIINRPWETPLTWGKLIEAGHDQGIDVEALLEKSVRVARDQEIYNLLLGYPLPNRLGQSPVEMHWQAIRLPKIESYKKKPRGRPTEKNFWAEDRRTILSNPQSVMYLRTENWHESRLRARGGLDNRMRNLQVVLIGVGALGSAVAEILVRGGLRKIQVIDEDIVEAGNLVRHTLTLDEVGLSKAEAIKKRLESITPNITVKRSFQNMPGDRKELQSLLEPADVIIDCTASDHVLTTLMQGWWSVPKIFVSVSLGIMGKRMFLYLVDNNSFPIGDFRKSISPWMQRESKQQSISEEINEGAGCWSPLFPCRFDDVLLAASIAVKVIEKASCERPVQPGLYVYEQKEDRLGISCFNLIKSSEVS